MFALFNYHIKLHLWKEEDVGQSMPYNFDFVFNFVTKNVNENQFYLYPTFPCMVLKW
jgi:hypothetical protein